MKQKIQQTYLKDQRYILADSNILYYAKAIDKPMIPCIRIPKVTVSGKIHI